MFSQFTAHLRWCARRSTRAGIALQVPRRQHATAERERRVAAFQAGGATLFLIWLRAGGIGLNLTAADYVIHLDPWWNPAVEDQASDRAHRIGQERPVTIYRLVMRTPSRSGSCAARRQARSGVRAARGGRNGGAAERGGAARPDPGLKTLARSNAARSPGRPAGQPVAGGAGRLGAFTIGRKTPEYPTDNRQSIVRPRPDTPGLSGPSSGGGAVPQLAWQREGRPLAGGRPRVPYQ